MRFPRILTVVGSFLLWGFIAPPAQPGILISELCDPRYNYTTDRFIEIYNSGGVAVDLSGWSLVAVGNGADIFTWDLSGMINPGEALVAGDQTTIIAFQVNFPDEAWSLSNGTWNGKVGDGAKLLDSGDVIIDIVVADITRFENDDYVRNQGITAPNTTYTPSEWTATPADYPTDGSPGIHYVLPPPPAPYISNIITDPAFPSAAVGVNVYADVTDSVATITSVVLRWGTTPSPLPNEIAMSLVSGSTYGTDTPLPGQPEGTTVSFEIQADNDSAGTSSSGLQSYSIPYELTIHEIQGEMPTSPYDGSTVITSGVITGRYGSYFAMQEGGGAWNGVWVESETASAVGDSVSVRGTVIENDATGHAGNTLLVAALLESLSSGVTLPGAAVVSTAEAASEDYEGVLVRVESAACTNSDVGLGEWDINDGSGTCRVGGLGYSFASTLGSSYDVIGPVAFTYGNFKIEPRDENDVVWVGDDSPPVIAGIGVMSDTTLLVTFSEEVEQTSAETLGNYTIDSLGVLDVEMVGGHPDQVVLTVSAMSEGEYTLTVNGVEDLYGNAMVDVIEVFDFVDTSFPEGYYDTAESLAGEELRAALHDIIKNHTAYSYDYAWTAFYTTDDKPNGKVWDIYSDVPGGTPPYEYTFGVDQGGVGGQEGMGYTREHSWPKSWFGGEVTPMYSDIFALYPCDAHVNGNRGVYPYGEVTSPVWISLNGSKVGLCSYPGYSETVFEPIDAYKGDLARTYFYMTTRYYTEDAGWPGSPMTDGADLLPWAIDMLLAWHEDDPVSQKELERNAAIYTIQNNRNPFIDRPEFATHLYVTAGVEGDPTGTLVAGISRVYPNPFNPSTTIRYSVPETAFVTVALYDVLGKEVAKVVDARVEAGGHMCTLEAGDLSDGVYFLRLQAGVHSDTQKIVVLK
ncbi:MAG: endonuclease [Candidatus Eisenbacteria bacterium]